MREIIDFRPAIRTLTWLAGTILAIFAAMHHSQAAPPTESVLIGGEAVHPTRILARRKNRVLPKAALQSVQTLNPDAVVSHAFSIVPELVVIDTDPAARSSIQTGKNQSAILAARIEKLKSSGLFEYVEPDRFLEMKALPTDRYLTNGSLWGLQNNIGLRGVDVGAVDAWRLTSGTSNTVVAVIDSGIDVQHPDLIANLWRNPRETPGNQRDDDGNGYVDDVHGIDLVASPEGAPLSKDENGHGTHVSGTIAATANNLGVVGLANGVRLMGIRTHDANGRGGAVSSIIKGIEYAVRHGARVINASFGGPVYSQAAFDAYSAAGDAGVIVISSAGNDAQNNDIQPNYPANYRLPNLLSVASVNYSGELSDFSNYGLDAVDLAAPGEDIISTYPGNSYKTLKGTSMAAPHVTAVAALVVSRFPDIGINELRQRLTQSTVPLPSLAGKVKTGGIINAYRALAINPDGYPEFTLRPAKGHFIAGRVVTVEVLATDVTPLAGSEMELEIASSPTVRLRDDGLPPDRIAADGVYTGVPAPQAFGNQEAKIRLQHRGRNWERQLPVLVEKPAENDYFSNRTTLVPDGSEVSGTTFGASVEALEPDLDGRKGTATVWYRFTPAISGTNALLVFGTDFEPKIRVYSGSTLGGLKVWTNGLASSNEALSQTIIYAQAGVPLAISVSSDWGEQGAFSLMLIDAKTPPRPPNDSRLKVSNLPLNKSFQVRATNTFATREQGEPLHAGATGGKSLWWRYEPPEDGVLEINTFGSNFDTVLAAYNTGKTVALVSNDDDKADNGVIKKTSRITVPVTQGQSIDIAVDGWNGDSGQIILNGKILPKFNDYYDYPIRLVSGTIKTGDNKQATKGSGEINHAGDRGGASVWYEWRAPVGGRATLTVAPLTLSTFSPRIAVYVGPEKILSQSDWDNVKVVTASKTGQVSFEAMAGQTYRIAVDGKYYRGCLGFCDAVERGDFTIVINQQAELNLLVGTGYELNNDAELITLDSTMFTQSLAGYWDNTALSGSYSRWFSATQHMVVRGYTNAADLSGGKIQLSCKIKHSGDGGSNSGWGIGFIVYPVGYSSNVDDLLAGANLLFFGFDSSGTEAGLLVGPAGGTLTNIVTQGLRISPGQKHGLDLRIDLSSQKFEARIDDGQSIEIPVTLFGRLNLAQGPFILSTPAAFPYPSLLLDDLEVRVLPRDLGKANSAPAFAELKPLVIEEENQFSTQLKVTDSDLPAQQLTVRLVSGPTGLVVSYQGMVTWTPTETQGPATYPVVVEVSDGDLSATNQFNVSVLEVNKPPAINAVPPSSIGEGGAWTQVLTATDPDLPANSFSFHLLSGPIGTSLDSKSGALRWTPTEADGGRDVEWLIEVTDGGQPPLSSRATVKVSVLEANEPPILETLADVALAVGQAFSIIVHATDNDVPAQILKYGLKNAPDGMILDTNTGEIHWVPLESQSSAIYPITVTVTDSVGAMAESLFVATVKGTTQPPTIKIEQLMTDGGFGLEIRASQGLTVALEHTSDLSNWAETQTVTGQGAGTPVRITLKAQPNEQTKFWRLRVR